MRLFIHPGPGETLPDNDHPLLTQRGKRLIDTCLAVTVLAGVSLIAMTYMDSQGTSLPVTPPPAAESDALRSSVVDIPQVAKQKQAPSTSVTSRPTHLQAVEHFLDTASAMAKGDAYAEEITTAFRAATMPVRVYPDASLRPTVSMRVPENVVMVLPVFPEEIPTVLASGEQLHTLSYNNGRMTLVYRHPWTDWFMGIVGIHEMVHWDDIVRSKREPAHTHPNSREWLMGEVRAHRLEHRLIDKHTGGAWTAAIRDAFDDDRFHAGEIDGFDVVNWDGVHFILDSLPDQAGGPDELALRNAAAMTSFTFEQCSLVDNECLMRAYKAMREGARLLR